MAALRDNEGKAKLSQLLGFKRAMVELARHTTQGRIKYPDTPDGQPNWSLGGKPDEEYLDAALRHITEVVCGNEVDPESDGSANAQPTKQKNRSLNQRNNGHKEFI